jgi:hypothetical protein
MDYDRPARQSISIKEMSGTASRAKSREVPSRPPHSRLRWDPAELAGSADH